MKTISHVLYNKSYSYIGFLFSLCLLFGCSRNEEQKPVDNESGYVTLSFGLGDQANQRMAENLSQIEALVATIVDNTGQMVYDRAVFPISGVGSSSLIHLNPGSYALSELLLIDDEDNIIYAAPKTNAELDYLVTEALSIDFTIVANETLELPVEVVSTSNTSLDQFGYEISDLQFTIVETFDLPISVLVYDDATDQYIPSIADLEVQIDGSPLFSKILAAELSYLKLRTDVLDYDLSVQVAGFDWIHTTINTDSLMSHSVADPLVFQFGELVEDSTKRFKIRQLLKHNSLDNTANVMSSYRVKILVPATATSDYMEQSFVIDENDGCVDALGTSLHGISGIPETAPYVVAVFSEDGFGSTDTLGISVVQTSSTSFAPQSSIQLEEDCTSVTCVAGDNCTTSSDAVDVSTYASATCNDCWLPDSPVIPFDNTGADPSAIVGIPMGGGDVNVKWVHRNPTIQSLQVTVHEVSCGGAQLDVIQDFCAGGCLGNTCRGGSLVYSGTPGSTVYFKLTTYSNTTCSPLPIDETCSSGVVIL